MPPVTFEYISAFDYCNPVSKEELFGYQGNGIYVHDVDVEEPPINIPGLQGRGAGFEALHPCDGEFVRAFAPTFNMQDHKIRPFTKQFIATLKDVRLEFPGFGIFPEKHLLLEETYHNQEWTEMASHWHGDRGLRKSMTVQVPGAGDDGQPANMNVRYYMDRTSDFDYQDAALMLSGPSAYNYSHWIVEMLPRLWAVDAIPELKKIPILVRAPLLPFQTETLLALGFGNVVPFTGQWLNVKRLYFPSYIAPGNYSIRIVRWIRENLMRAYNIQEQADPQNLIYISRRQAGSRRLLNEELLIPELERRGFQILEMEGYSVRDQIDTFSKAKFIVMPHGAAITNMVFASPGATLIEMMPASYQHSFGVIYTTHSRCNYGTIICDDSANPMTKDISVDIPGLLRAVDKVLEG